MTLKDPELPKLGAFIDFCDLRLQCTIHELTVAKWLEIG